MNAKGTILLYVMVLMAVLLAGLTALVRTSTYYRQMSQLNYQVIKTEYLAQSGVNIAPRLFQAIPNQSIPSTNTKEWLYARLSQALKIHKNLDGEIYLMRKSNTIYAMGILENKYKCIFKATYEATSQNIKIISSERI